MEDRTELGDQSDRGDRRSPVYGRPSRTFRLGPGVCRAGLWDTKLSIYNDDEYCCLHISPQHAPGSGGRRSPDAGDGAEGPRITTGPGAPYTGDVTAPCRGTWPRRVATWVGAPGLVVGPPRGRRRSTPPPWPSSRRISPRPPPRPRRLVIEATGLRPRHRRGRALVVDRAGWVRANVSSFRRLLEPVLEKLETGPPCRDPWPGAARRATGAQLGLVLGWMSTRVLGQYDLLLRRGEDTGRRRVLRGPQHRGARAAPRLSRHSSSGCGSPCTRSPTAASSPASPGCAPTSSPWSTRRMSAHRPPTPTGSPRPCGGPPQAVRRARTPSRRRACSAWSPRPSSSR